MVVLVVDFKAIALYLFSKKNSSKINIFEQIKCERRIQKKHFKKVFSMP
jgi:hypothetical protein